MSQLPSLPEDRDAQFEWFRSAVQLLREQGTSAVSETMRAGLDQFTLTNLPEHSFPAGLDQQAFAAEVLKLKDNDTSWNRALQSALVAAYDQAGAGGHRNAAEDLEAFARTCQWALYAEVARTEAERIAGLGQRE